LPPPRGVRVVLASADIVVIVVVSSPSFTPTTFALGSCLGTFHDLFLRSFAPTGPFRGLHRLVELVGGLVGLCASLVVHLFELLKVASVIMQALVVEVDDVGGDRVQETTVVRDDDEGLLPSGEVLFEPEDGAEVEMVGWLIGWRWNFYFFILFFLENVSDFVFFSNVFLSPLLSRLRFKSNQNQSYLIQQKQRGLNIERPRQ